jgi:hypothetical protein
MGLLLFLPAKDEPGSSLLQIIKTAVPDYEIEIYSSISQLMERLQKPLLDVSVAVLYASSRSELMEIIYLGDLLGELRVVLVLPDGQMDILNIAHALRPRLIASAESDFKYLGSVLKKMINLYDRTH